MSANNGGPAFPAPNFIVPRDLHEAGCRKIGEAMGMTLRDYFAAKAMQAMISTVPHDCVVSVSNVAEQSYYHADAMLKARES